MHESGRGQSDLRILVVDDNHDAANSMSMLLQLEGYQTGTAHDGLAAILEATRVRYHVVLLDLGLPIMDGFQAALALRQLEPAPVLIACTAWGDAETRKRTADSGFYAHLVKPVPLAVLKATLMPAIRTVSGNRQRPGGQAQEVTHPYEFRQ
jgi:CheY-like chemotaxis protein